MAMEQALAQLGQLVVSPADVQSLRNLILKMAFDGALVPVSNGGSPRSTWFEERLDDLTESIVSGFACSRSHQQEGGLVHLRTHNIATDGRMNTDLLVTIDPAQADPRKSTLAAGDVLFNNTNSQELVGKTCIVGEDLPYGFSNHLTRIRVTKKIDSQYLALYFTYLRNIGYFSSICTRWINQAGVNTKTIKKEIVPHPLLGEQKRIVAKVIELMALCDRLEAQLNDARQIRQSILETISSGPAKGARR